MGMTRNTCQAHFCVELRGPRRSSPIYHSNINMCLWLAPAVNPSHSPAMFHRVQCLGSSFLPFTLPFGEIAHRHNLLFHVYVDDTQLYLSFNHNDRAMTNLAMNTIENCISEIKHWMLLNKLKVNGKKTGFIQILNSTKSVTTSSLCLWIGLDSVHTSMSATNLGVTIDSKPFASQQTTNSFA